MNIKTKGKHTPLFFPAGKLIILNKEHNTILTYSKGSSNLLYQGEDAEGVYQDILITRKQFWDISQNNTQDRLKLLLNEFPYLTAKDVTDAQDYYIEKNDLYLPLLPNACSRVQIEEGKELSEVIIEEEGKKYIYVCNKDSLKGLPSNNIDIYNKLIETVEFFYTIDGLIKGSVEKERVLYYPPIKDWYKYTPEIGSNQVAENSKVIQLTPTSSIKTLNIEEVDRIKKVLDKKLKEDFLRKVQLLIN